ncbi:type I-D CRISPR-associated endonuclease Cas1d [Phormidium yuhuli AB48]|uniref:CRISPR-associated endonuclease Cas1 n=1 Tax=Phormidium yuhuli AB48 TaxID=2940671 RepID=A0ABY5AQ03_9CYAN|nr:type I-D CRISPR-associated endonuclease Cas1d [Phormidium yuhuli]USR91292.1 type I-D CRISPR-associated endonuclease Cas1d [Phormidium yuhuli AB48]
MGTMYVMHDDVFLGKLDERLQIKHQGERLADVPLLKLQGVVVLGRATMSPSVVDVLLERNIPLSFLTRYGKYRGRLEPEVTRNIFVRRGQWTAAGDTETARTAVRGFVRGKLKNYRSLLQRKQRDGEGLDVTGAIQQLQGAIAALPKTPTIDQLRGYEGAGSAAYFGVFNQLLQGTPFEFTHRNRRPPKDPVNSLLSLGYALLRHDVQSALNIVGFDPYLGYLHTERYGRPSLALDVMEEFRPLVVDAMVLSLLKKPNGLGLGDFEQEPLNGAVSLTGDGLKRFLRAYEEKKQSEFKHPVMGRKCTYQEAFEIQGRLLAKFLMGEIESYPPLVLR